MAVVATLLFALTWMVFFYQHDGGKPEPPWRVALALLLGALAVGPAIAWEGWAFRYIDASSPLGRFVGAFGVVGFGEECLKFAAAYVAAYRLGSSTIRLPVDAMIYGIASGLGFAAVENVLYARAFGLEVLALRAVVGFVVHAAFGGLSGYFVGLELSRGRRVASGAVAGLTVAGFLHGLYDYAIVSQWLTPAGVVLAVGALYALLAGRLSAAQRVPA